jgi:hypothetical protein
MAAAEALKERVVSLVVDDLIRLQNEERKNQITLDFSLIEERKAGSSDRAEFAWQFINAWAI